MKHIYSNFPKPGSEPIQSSTAICIGNFDGCHTGHQELISQCKRIASQKNLIPCVVTFSPHPKEFFQNLATKDNIDFRAKALLFNPEQKTRCLEELGIKIHLTQKFEHGFATQSPEEFFQNFLVNHLSCKALIIGHDFRFGKGRSGDAQWLSQACKDQGIEFFQEPAKTIGTDAVSSTLIRGALQRDGNIQLANELLGRPYLVEGKVVAGKKIGREIGFPTANIQTSGQVLPIDGVYIAAVSIDQGPVKIFANTNALLPSVVNIGSRPTVDATDTQIVLETHILEDFKDNLYDKKIAVYFLKRIRNEENFGSIDALKVQISKDVETAKLYFEID